MEDNQGQTDPNSPSNNHQRGTTERSEPVRSRWTPKPEQILILESIFNSGMVNPPKDETVRIRKLLETFGSVGDANVFYWFQNRRSRSRRRQRQMQASLQGGGGDQRNSSSSSNNNNNFIVSTQAWDSSSGGGAIHQYAESGIYSTNYMSMGFSSSASTFVANSSPSSYLFGSSSSCGVVGYNGMESLFPMSNQMGLHEIDQYGPGISHPVYCSSSSSSSSSETSDLHHQTGGFVTVFINGVPTEVPRRPIDTKAMFGEDVILVHSTGFPIPTNEFGFLMQSLQHGESYFLVSRPA